LDQGRLTNAVWLLRHFETCRADPTSAEVAAPRVSIENGLIAS
jgi:hypothetical protein